jgi:hypothetical protein
LAIHRATNSGRNWYEQQSNKSYNNGEKDYNADNYDVYNDYDDNDDYDDDY